MKKSVTNTTLGLIALATMSFAASHAQANHDTPQRFDQHHGQSWQDRGDYGPRQGHRVNQQRIAEINARHAKQQNRVERAMWNGNLNRGEYRTLISELQYFDTVKRDFMSDGFLTPSEIRQLENGLDAAARNFQTAKHDDDDRDFRTSSYDNARYGHRWGHDR